MVMEVELNFMYDFLYTKMAVVHGGIAFIFRVICTLLICVCVQQFASLPHHKMVFNDRLVTYILLSGAIFLDMVNLFNLVFSDWMIVFGPTWVSQLVIRLSFWKRSFRWSNSIYQHSFISFCLNQRVKLLDKIVDHHRIKVALDKWLDKIVDRHRIKVALYKWLDKIVDRRRIQVDLDTIATALDKWLDKIVDVAIIKWLNKISNRLEIKVTLNKWLDNIAVYRGIKDALNTWLYKEEIRFKEDLKKLIFDELKSKADEADSKEIAKKIYSARGCWALSKHPIHDPDLRLSISSTLDDEVEYDESVLLWHIATELCYSDSCGKCDDPNPKRERCKVLSNYMLYLLVMRPTTMSAVAGIAQIRYQDTCEEAKKFFQQKRLEKKVACEMLLGVKTDVNPSEVKGDRSKSLLFDACILAKNLNKLKNDERWDMMSSVWVELLSFAAGRMFMLAYLAREENCCHLFGYSWFILGWDNSLELRLDTQEQN